MSRFYKKTEDALDALLGNYVAEHEGDKLASEYDNLPHGKRRPELEQRIEKMIQDRQIKTKKSATFHVIKVLIVATLVLFLTGGLAVKAWDYFVRDNKTHSDIFQNVSVEEIKASGIVAIPKDLPAGYTAIHINTTDGYQELFFEDSNGNLILFTQSEFDFTNSVDTENVETESIILLSGYEGVLIKKDGTSLLWEQDGYFYLIRTSNADIDLVELASSLTKI